MPELTIHMRGTGAVALAYGYYFTARGHRVLHSSVSGRSPPILRVRLETRDGTTQSTYVPRYLPRRGGSTKPEVTIAAISLEADGPPAGWAGGHANRRSPTSDLLFSSLFEEAAYRQALARRASPLRLIYPIISCEYCAECGLNIATDWEVEPLRPAGEQGPQQSDCDLLSNLGLSVSVSVGVSRFRTRYVQTSAVYVVLMAVKAGLMSPHGVDAELFARIYRELAAMADSVAGEPSLDLSIDPQPGFSAASSLIAMLEESSAENVLFNNIRCLVHHGTRKLSSHLGVIRRSWFSYLGSPAALPASGTQDMISAVLGITANPDLTSIISPVTPRAAIEAIATD
ncbi:MAG TPA: hypothetical protein VHM92_07785 [Allosphingosinicella sp.]|nr:hypothetical protein [Allosphingosinicella sp.]